MLIIFSIIFGIIFAVLVSYIIVTVDNIFPIVRRKFLYNNVPDSLSEKNQLTSLNKFIFSGIDKLIVISSIFLLIVLISNELDSAKAFIYIFSIGLTSLIFTNSYEKKIQTRKIKDLKKHVSQIKELMLDLDDIENNQDSYTKFKQLVLTSCDNDETLSEKIDIKANTYREHSSQYIFNSNTNRITGNNQISAETKVYDKRTITKVANKIEKLLDYVKQKDPPITKVQQMVKTAAEELPEILNAEIVEIAINSSPSLKKRIVSASIASSLIQLLTRY